MIQPPRPSGIRHQITSVFRRAGSPASPTSSSAASSETRGSSSSAGPMPAVPHLKGLDLPASGSPAPGALRPHQVRANGKAALVSEIDPELHAGRYAALPNGCVVPALSVAHRTDAILLHESFVVIPGEGIECPMLYDVVSDPML